MKYENIGGNIVTTELEMLAWTSALTVIMWLPYILGHIKNVGLMSVLTYSGADVRVNL